MFITLYGLIFKETISHESLKFFRDTSDVAIGTLFGALLTLTFNIIAARTLGPTYFGNLALVITVSLIISIPMGINHTGSTKYGSQAHDDTVRSRIISTYGLQTAVLTVGSIAIYVLFYTQLSNVFGVSIELYFFVIAHAAISVFYLFSLNSLRILFKIRTYALLTSLQSVVTLAAFLIFISVNMRSWQAAVFSLYIGYAAITVISVVSLKQYLKPQFDRFWSKKIMNYAGIALPGIVAWAFMGVDKILINKLITTAAVGTYDAYCLPTITVAITMWGIFSAALLPYASKSKDKLSIFHKVNKAVPALTAAMLPFIMLIELVMFIFFGPQYPFSAELGLLFALAAIALFLYLIYGSLMSSEGARGAKVTSVGGIIALAVIVTVNVLLLPLIGISGAAVALIFAYLAGTIYLVSKSRVLSAD